jgi:hypothetical protein
MGGSSAAGTTAEAQPPKVVESSPVFDFRNPLDIGFFDKQATKQPAQDQSRVVKIAQGGYMDVLFPKEEVSMDEILRILEGK